MARPRIRWWVALVTWLLGMLACACSNTAAKPAQAPGPRTQAARKPKASTSTANSPKQARTPATGKARQHPFTRVGDGQARHARLATTLGPLTLKAVLGGAERMAIIQEATTTHVVREGEYIGGLAVLSIREGEVVLGSGPRKRILSLYTPDGD